MSKNENKELKKIRAAKYRQLNKEKLKLQHQIYNKTIYSKRPRRIFNKYKYGATSRGYSYEITFEEFMKFWGKNCYYCGSKIERIGLDRVDNTKGYFMSNIVPCCYVCNKMKMRMEKDFFIDHVKKIYEFNFKNGDK